MQFEGLGPRRTTGPRRVWLFIAFLVISPALVHAEIETSGSGSQSLRYRQLYVPVDHPDAWPRDGQKFIPVEAEQLQQWIQQANANSQDDPWQQARISSAIYLARWDKSRLVGTGQFEIEASPDYATILFWEGASLSLADAQWKRMPPIPAQFGLWGRNDKSPARMGLLVEGPGKLGFRWHMDSTSSQGETPMFRLSFPPSLRSYLFIDLPDSKRPSIEGGVVLPPAEAAAITLPAGERAPPSGMQRWAVAKQNASSVALQIVDEHLPSAAVYVAPMVRQKLEYRLSPRGIDLAVAVQLESTNVPPQLSFLLDADAHVSSASINGRTIPWHVSLGENKQVRVVTVELPASFQSEQTISLSAWAPILLDQIQELPDIRIQQHAWSTGKIQVFVSASLDLKELVPYECVQHAVSSAEDAEGDVLVFDQLSPDARLEFLVGPRRSRPARKPAVAVDEGLSQSDPAGTADLPSAEIDLVATIGARRLKTEYRITYQPHGRSIDDFWIYSSERLPKDTKWIDEATGEILAPAFDESQSAAKNLLKNGHLWCIRLLQPRLDAVVIRLQADFPLDDDLLIPLVMLPEYERQTGRVVLCASEDAPWTVRQQRLVPTSLPSFSAEDSQPVRAAYRYDPRQFIERGTTPQLELARLEQHGVPLLVAVRVELESAYSADGAARHQIAYSLENHGKREFEFKLPPSMELTSAWVNGNSVAPGRSGHGELLKLPLNSRKQSSNVTLEFLDNDSSLGTRGRIVAPLPDVELPILGGRWTIWMPSDYTIPEATVIAPAPPGWRQRLFGFLGRPGHREPTNLWNKSDWTRIWNQTQRQDQAIGEVRRLLERIGRRILDENGDSRTTWAKLFSEVVDVAAQSDPLVVDYWSLARQGLYANTLVKKPRQPDLPVSTAIETEEERTAAEYGSVAVNFLAENQLAILISSNRVILTTSEQIAAIHPGPQSLALPGVFRSNEAVLQSVAMASPDAWVLVSMPTSTLSYGRRFRTVAGWHVFHIPLVEPPHSVAVVAEHSQKSWIGGAFLVAVCGGAWLRRRWPRILSGLLLVVVAFCLMVPPWLTPIASALLLGILCVMLGIFLWKPLNANGSVAASFPNSAKTLTFLAITSATVFAPWQHVTAQEVAGTSSDLEFKAIDAIHPVLIPIDRDGRIAESKRYVDARFLRELMSLAKRDSSRLGQWLIRSSRFVGHMPHEGQATDADFIWTAEFDVQVFARDTAAHLSLRRDDFAELPHATVDGIPVRLAWEPVGGCTVRIAEPGAHRLVLQFRPEIRPAEGVSSIRLRIPHLADAKLQLEGPLPPQLKVQGVRLDASPSATTMPVHWSLAGADQLEIQWGAVPSAGGVETSWQVDRMIWLRVQPEGIWVDVKLVFVGSGNLSESFTMQADRRWNLEANDDSGVDVMADTGGNYQVFRVAVPKPAADRLVVPLRFQRHEGAFVGNLDLGELPSTSIPVRATWVAMSVDPTLAASVSNDQPVTSVDLVDFDTQWNEEDESPQVAYQSQNPHSAWLLSLRPELRVAVVEDRSAVFAEHGKIRLQYDADVAPGPEERFQFRLQVPENLNGENVTVVQDGQPTPLRWSRVSPTKLNVFFKSPLAGPYHLALSGIVSGNQGERVPLPVVRMAANASRPCQVSVYRDDQVLVEVTGATGSNEDAETVVTPPGEYLRFVGNYEFGEQAAAAQLRIRPNKTAFEGESLTTITKVGDGWTASYACRLRVKLGVLGQVILTAPASWTGPYATQPAAEMSVVNSEHSSQKLTVHLPQPVGSGEEILLRVESPIAVEPDQSLTAPIIRLEDSGDVSAYVAVPSKAERQSFQWQTEGVTPVSMPQAWRSDSVSPIAQTFRVVSKLAELKLHPQTSPVASPSVALADTSVFVARNGGQLTVTRFALRPEGVTACMLRVPEEYQLVDVTVSGHRPFMSRVEGAWQIALESPYLAQLVEVTLKAPFDDVEDPAELVIQRPCLTVGDRTIPVEVNLWSVWRHASATSAQTEATASNRGVELAVLRLEKLLGVVEGSSTLALLAPKPDGVRWLEPWEDKLMSAANDLRLKLARPTSLQRGPQIVPQSESPLGEVVRRTEDWLAKFRQQLSPNSSTSLSVNTARSQADRAWLSGSMSGLRGTYYVSDGSSDRLILDNGGEDGMSWPARLSIASGVALLAFGLAWVDRWPVLRDVWWRWSGAFGVVAGLVAWASITPSLIGLMIIGVSLFIVIRPGWASSQWLPEGSTLAARQVTPMVP